MVVLRSKKDDRILGMAYSEDGLKYINNKIGKLIYFKNAVIKHNAENIVPNIVGDVRKADNVYVTEYKHIQHKNPSIQKMENFWSHVYMQKQYNNTQPREEQQLVNEWLNKRRYGIK